MTTAVRSLILAALFAPGVILGAAVDDGAKLFSKEAVEKAEKKIADIKRAYKRDVVIETFAQAKDVDKAKADPAGYFSAWSLARYADRKVEGVYVLISNDPNRVQVAVGKRTEAQAFDRARQTALRERFISHFKEKKFDDGLLAAVDYVNDVFAARLKPSPTAAPSGATGGMPDWVGWVCVGLVGLLAVWVVVGLFRSFSGAGGQGQPGGGGFFSSLLGGMLGAAAGMYLYNSFFGQNTPSAFGGGHDPAAGMNDSTASTDGGGWDDNAGGGDDWGGGGGDDW